MKVEIKEEPLYEDEADQAHSSSQADEVDVKPLMKFSSPRSKKCEDPNYHYCYKKSSQAIIPEMTTEECTDDDNETAMLCSSEQKITHNDVETLKQAMPHLSIEVLLPIYMACNSDVDCTMRAAKNLVKVDVLPEYVKRMIRANIAVERSGPKSTQPYKVQHFVTMFKHVADPKSITEFYYMEKNKLGNDWRLEREERELTEAEKKELDEKLTKCDITIIEQSKVKLGKRKSQGGNTSAKKVVIKEEPLPSSSSNGMATRSTPQSNGNSKTVTKATRSSARNSR